jgi:hypothetical protein
VVPAHQNDHLFSRRPVNPNGLSNVEINTSLPERSRLSKLSKEESLRKMLQILESSLGYRCKNSTTLATSSEKIEPFYDIHYALLAIIDLDIDGLHNEILDPLFVNELFDIYLEKNTNNPYFIKSNNNPTNMNIGNVICYMFYRIDDYAPALEYIFSYDFDTISCHVEWNLRQIYDLMEVEDAMHLSKIVEFISEKIDLNQYPRDVFEYILSNYDNYKSIGPHELKQIMLNYIRTFTDAKSVESKSPKFVANKSIQRVQSPE